MIKTYNMHEAKTHLSRLVDSVVAGDEVIIAKAGKPLARVVPFDKAPDVQPRRRGFLAGQITVPGDFDTMFADEIEAMFNGDDEASA